MRILYLPNEYSQQRQKEKKRWIYPVRLAMEATYMRDQGHQVCWDLPANKHFDKIVMDPDYRIPFSDLPAPDRVLTGAKNPKWQKNGNFKYHPATYMQVAEGCWWGKCDFCVEKTMMHRDTRDLESIHDEVLTCKSQGFKEIFDDSATFPTGPWLQNFCYVMEPLGIKFGCNMRMIDEDYSMMKAAGFRMVLFGLESANQETLDKINKGVKVEDHQYIIKAAKAGLEPHIAVMFGYPWESDKDAENTLKLVWYLLKRGYAKTAQASFYSAQGQLSQEGHRKNIARIYEVAKSPGFWMNKLRDIHDVADLKYFWRQIKEGIKNA